MYLHERENWTDFHWDDSAIVPELSDVRNKQGRLLGRLDLMGFDLQAKAELEIRCLDVIKSSAIEGVSLDASAVRSSIAKRLGLEYGGFNGSTHDVDGVVDMTLDATQNFNDRLTKKRIFGWHAALFPTGYSGMSKIDVGRYRRGEMEVVSGAIGHEKIHYRAPDPKRVAEEMRMFLAWVNATTGPDLVIKAAIAHLWFVSIHPFDDGNGRIARALTDMLLARSDDSPRRFYSMSSQILAERKQYYDILESTQKGTGEITDWIKWFFTCLNGALVSSEKTLEKVIISARFWQRYADAGISERQHKVLLKLLEGFEGKLTSSKWARMTKVSQDTALRDIQELVTKGILEGGEAGGRSMSYRLTSFY